MIGWIIAYLVGMTIFGSLLGQHLKKCSGPAPEEMEADDGR